MTRGGGEKNWNKKVKLWQGFLENTVLEAENNVSRDVAEKPIDSEDARLSEQKGVKTWKMGPKHLQTELGCPHSASVS